MEETTTLNYFLCTLGEAAIWNREHPHPFHTVNHLIDEQAKELPQRTAVNFPGACNGEDGREMKSGRHLFRVLLCFPATCQTSPTSTCDER